MIHDIMTTAKEAGKELTPLLDSYALNVELDNIAHTGKGGIYIMLPKQETTTFGEYDRKRGVSVEIVAAQVCPFGKDGITDFHNVDALATSLKREIKEVIDAIFDTGRYDNVERIQWTIIPYRYDSFCTAVSALFTLNISDLC